MKYFPNDIAGLVMEYLFASFAQVSAGAFHTCAVKSDGTLLCWGANTSGQTTIPAAISGD